MNEDITVVLFCKLKTESAKLKMNLLYFNSLSTNPYNERYRSPKKSYAFAIRIIKLSQFLREKKKEYIVSKQIGRSGTAIGALIREAEHAQSRADFINKMNIALKEANESEYWLSLLYDTNFIEERLFHSLLADCKELIAMLVATVKTAKKRASTSNV